MTDDDSVAEGDLWISPEVDATVRDLEEELGVDPQDRDQLNLTGLEVVIVPLALKFVVGVVSSFVGKVAYQRWKEARTEKKLKELAGALQFEVRGPDSVVGEDVLRHDMVAAFVEQGLKTDQAIRVVDKALARIKENLVGT